MTKCEPYVTAKQVADHFVMSESAIRKATTNATNPIPHHRVPGGRTVRYRISEVDAWLISHETPRSSLVSP